MSSVLSYDINYYNYHTGLLMVSVNEFWIILGLAVIISLLLGAGGAYFLLPKPKSSQDESPEPKKRRGQNKAKERIRRMYALITELTVTLNYSRVLEKSLDAAFLALRILDMPTDRLISVVLLFAEEEMAVPDLVVAYGRGLPALI